MNGKFFELDKAVWKQKAFGLKMKVRVFEACVLSVLKDGAETWTCNKRLYDKLDVFQTKKLRMLLGIRRENFLNSRENNRLPKKVLFDEVEKGKKKRKKDK